MKNFRLTLITICLSSIYGFCQSTIISPTNMVATSTTKPIVLPRLTAAAIWVIQNPLVGTLVYDTTFGVLRIYNGTTWHRFKSIGTAIYPSSSITSGLRKEETASFDIKTTSHE